MLLAHGLTLRRHSSPQVLAVCRLPASTDDSGRPPDGRTACSVGGAEGTRTPDPHTASQALAVRGRPGQLATSMDRVRIVRQGLSRTGLVDATVDATRLAADPGSRALPVTASPPGSPTRALSHASCVPVAGPTRRATTRGRSWVADDLGALVLRRGAGVLDGVEDGLPGDAGGGTDGALRRWALTPPAPHDLPTRGARTDGSWRSQCARQRPEVHEDDVALQHSGPGGSE